MSESFIIKSQCNKDACIYILYTLYCQKNEPKRWLPLHVPMSLWEKFNCIIYMGNKMEKMESSLLTGDAMAAYMSGHS